MNDNIKKILEDSNYINKQLFDDIKNSSQYRWENKEIKQQLLIYKPSIESLKNITPPKTGEIFINNDIHDENNCSLEIKTNGIIKNGFSRSTCGIVINFDKVNMDNYNRVYLNIFIKATGYQNFYFHFQLGSSKGIVHTASIPVNKWTKVIWELDDKDTEVDKISITPFLFGCPPEGLTDVSFYIDNIYLQEVDMDYCLGWDVHNRIAYCHAGYYTNGPKSALIQNTNEKYFCLLDEKNNEVYKDEVQIIKTDLGVFEHLNFTKFHKDGIYKIKVGEYETEYFELSDNPFMSSIVKSINFLRLLRCGEDIDGVHSACHLNCRTVHENGNSVPNFGGWHDAGDVSQFEICTAEMAHALLDLSFKIKDKKLKQRILDEARVGINWLLRTRFSDGSRALAVGYNIWRNNELEADDLSVLASKAEKGPFESFCSAAALAVASRCYADYTFREWCLRIAKEDFEYARKWYKEGIHTKRWGKNIDSQVCGHGLIAAAELYKKTNDKYYIDVAVELSKVVMSCQETEYILFKSITGFFYEDPEHKYVLSYEHRGHEQSPIQGLCRILQVYPEIENSEDIKKSIALYMQYTISTIRHTYPYHLLPAHIYNLNKINPERFTIPSYMCTEEEGINELKNQIKQGIHLIDDWYLRIFPIAVQRRGFHATLLSKAKAISMIAKTFDISTYREIAIKQLQWVLGFNPFASSTMYGEGHNYHPLYVAFSKQMVGALPVGIMTKGDKDLPYWPTYNNAVFKEIWGHTTGKYLWVLADIL